MDMVMDMEGLGVDMVVGNYAGVHRVLYGVTCHTQ